MDRGIVITTKTLATANQEIQAENPIKHKEGIFNFFLGNLCLTLSVHPS